MITTTHSYFQVLTNIFFHNFKIDQINLLFSYNNSEQLQLIHNLLLPDYHLLQIGPIQLYS